MLQRKQRLQKLILLRLQRKLWKGRVALELEWGVASESETDPLMSHDSYASYLQSADYTTKSIRHPKSRHVVSSYVHCISSPPKLIIRPTSHMYTSILTQGIIRRKLRASSLLLDEFDDVTKVVGLCHRFVVRAIRQFAPCHIFRPAYRP